MKSEMRKKVEFCMGKNVEGEGDLSLVAQFDQLVRNRAVLTAAEGEEKFLAFVKGADGNRQRWEAAEVECDKLTEQLTKSTQEVSMLEGRLDQARGMLQTEVEGRRRAELERDLLAQKFQAVQSLVLEGSAGGVRRSLHQQVSRILGTPETGGGPIFPSIHLDATPRADRTDGSVLDVDDLSLDDTADLCQDSPLPPNSGRRSRSRGGRKRSRSKSQGRVLDRVEEWVEEQQGRLGERLEEASQVEEQDRIRERMDEVKGAAGVAAALRSEVESLRKVEAEVEQLRKRRDEGKVEEAKRRKRSHSVGQRESIGVHTRSQSLQVRGGGLNGGSPAGHNMAQKTVLKSEKCGVCAKRMKFGKIGLRCIVCKLSLHTDCAPGMPSLCLGPTATTSSPTLVSRTPARSPDNAGRTRTRPPLFASPMLR